jgi:hypothetical protein
MLVAVDSPESGVGRIDAVLEQRGPVAYAAAGALGLVVLWLIHPILPGASEHGFKDGMKLVIALAFFAMLAPVLLLEGLSALRRPAAAPTPPPTTPARFAAFDESLQRGRQWRRRLGFCLVGAAHALVWLATI